MPQAGAAACGIGVSALLAAAVPPLRSLIAGVALLAAGLGLGTWTEGETRRDLALVESIGEGRFARIRVPLERGWEVKQESVRMRARWFAIEDGTRRERIALPIMVTLWDRPPQPGRARWLEAEGFLRCRQGACRMSVKSARLLRLGGELPRWSPARWNRAAFLRIAALGSGSPMASRGAAQAAALALGRGELLDPEVREAYRRGGTYHLLVFSGMQIAFAAGLVSAVFRRLGRPRPGDWILLAMAIVAPPFAGHDPSVARSATMIGLYAISRIAGRPTSLENLFFVSGLARLALVPSDLSEPGFALTWGATGGLILLGPRFAARFRGNLPRALAYGAGAELGIGPVTSHFFHQLVIGSSVVTILAAPLLGVMLGLSAAACAAAFVQRGIARLLLEAIGRLDALAVAGNLLVADRLGIARIVASPPALLVASVFTLALLVLVLARRGAPVAVALVLVPLAWSFTAERLRARVDGLEIEMLDVGQGDAILIRSKESTMLVDGGGRRGEPFFGRDVLLPMLVDRGVRRIDVVVMTHADPDHCGGLPAVLQTLRVGRLWISSHHLREPCAAGLFDLAVRRRIAVVPIDRRPPGEAGELRVSVFAAEPPFRRSAANNGSLVLRIEGEGRSLLLTGDLERQGEFQLLETAPGMVRCDILKVPHHGSASSSSEALIRRARPRLALVSAGRNNRFGHPTREVLERLERAGARIYRTDLDGTIRLRVRAGTIRVTSEIDRTGPAGSL